MSNYIKKNIPFEKKENRLLFIHLQKKLITIFHDNSEIIQIFVAVNNNKNQNNFSTLEI